jgi:cyanophycinase-like exopeptidase
MNVAGEKILRSPFSWGPVVMMMSLACVANDDFQYYVSGDPADVSTETSGLIVLQGGGTDVDANYTRMGERSGGGDFVVLRASGADEYNDYIKALCNCDSVETLVFENRDAAYDDFVIQKIRHAEALFIAGGDQGRYVRFWKGTPVEDAIHYLAGKPVPIGGTSAGMAILGQFSYSAMTEDSLTADAALSDPFHHDLTLEADFLHLPGLENVITDQHLIERNRIGRTVALLARLTHDGLTSQGRAMAADRETSVHVDPLTGDISVYATPDHETPFVYFLRTTKAPAVCKPGQPLSIADVQVYRISPGASFNVKKWSGEGGISYMFNVENGTLSSSRGEIY